MAEINTSGSIAEVDIPNSIAETDTAGPMIETSTGQANGDAEKSNQEVDYANDEIASGRRFKEPISWKRNMA